MGIATTNPATGQVVQTFEPLTVAELDERLALAHQGFEAYRWSSFTQRATGLQQAADILEQGKDTYGRLMTLEMGKPIRAAIAEVEKCAWVCRYYAQQGEAFLSEMAIPTEASWSGVRYQPLGPILAVMPWNFPFWQVFRCAAPALMAGNVVLLKHASNVPQCALALEAIFHQAGFPLGVFQTLLIGAAQVEGVMMDERVKAATLTGSEKAGASLGAIAGRQIKKTVLELGGSDPFIVLPSADLDRAVTAAVTSRMLNNGQSCIAAKRFIVAEAIADSFVENLTTKFAALRIGDPLEANTDIGPLATEAIRKELDQLVQGCITQGANLVIGGQPLDGPGYYYPPTILTDIPPHTSADGEEFFGPVALVYRVSDLDAAIHRANASPWGLGASAWTTLPAEQERLINELEAGAVFINGLVKSDPRLPFGGIKRSGYGRELGIQGIHEFVNIKTVWVK